METAVFMTDGGQSATEKAYSPAAREELGRLFDFPADTTVTRESMDAWAPVLAKTRYIFSTWGMPRLDEEEIARYLPRLEVIFYAAGSVQPFARPFLNRGVRLFSAWAANGVPVAEYAASQIILASKGFFQCCARFSGDPGAYSETKRYAYSCPGNYDIRVGILGAGAIGSLVIQRLKNCDLELVVFDPFFSEERAGALGVVKAGLEEVFATCQTVSCHLANNPQTVGMLNYELFSKMGPTAAFINTGRGAQVVEGDLIRALEEEPGRTAVLDVTFPEPPPPGHAFYSLPNVFLTPHIAGSMHNEVLRMGRYMLEECRALLDGAPTRYEVTEKMLATMA